ncbi:MAG: UDP-N-acetylmuramoyl-L-alanyl-D-glutamate--2,6-diaminopimelate ligase [Pseudomonadota bacterium]|jgi:UDP-N-acetylmuramoyl-L-alanyl-D-glutamate--2,6-diaminopimelate ligase
MIELQTPQQAAKWLRQSVTGALRADSRKVGAGDGFIAWPGAAVDGRRFVPAALAQGAAACLIEAQGSEAWRGLEPAQRVASLPNLKRDTGVVADAFYAHPSERLHVLAVTGTNGKTSTACWLAQALSAVGGGQRCGVVGTLGVGIWPTLEYTGMTTPDPVRLQQTFADVLQAGATYCAIEASSIGLAEHRLDGTRIRTAIFTNFTQDHLDYHGSMQAYWEAKRALFDWVGLQAAVIHVDDPQGAKLARELETSGLDLWTCSRQGDARLRARQVPHTQGLSFDVYEGEACCRVQTGLAGDYNIDNLLCVIAALRTQGVSLQEAADICGRLSAVPGRMQTVALPQGVTGPLALVDYAHTPDALEHALQALRPLASERGGRLWCVFGCGGDRDAAKRPLMGGVAERGADVVVLTSDNPRSESAADILEQVRAGWQRGEPLALIEDRAAAIRFAISQASAQDVVLVAGKGHETTQEMAGVFHPFSDTEHIAQALMGVHA